MKKSEAFFTISETDESFDGKMEAHNEKELEIA